MKLFTAAFTSMLLLGTMAFAEDDAPREKRGDRAEKPEREAKGDRGGKEGREGRKHRKPSPEMMKRLIAKFDADGDGKLNEAERKTAHAAMKKHHADAKGKKGDCKKGECKKGEKGKREDGGAKGKREDGGV